MSRVDVYAIVSRLDVDRLPEIIRESTGSMASDVVRDVRMQSIDADVAIARLIDRILRRRRARRTDAPGEAESLTRANPPEPTAVAQKQPPLPQQPEPPKQPPLSQQPEPPKQPPLSQQPEPPKQELRR